MKWSDKIKIILFSLVPIYACFLSSAAFAEGYLVTLKEDVVVPYSLESDIERVNISNEIMYRADSVEDIYNFTDSDNILSIIRDFDVELFDAPNDTYYANQWNLSAVNSLYAYEKGLRGNGVKIGIIDSGINYGHEDISTDKITQRYNIFDESEDVTDELGHGSFVSGIIAADINNQKGVAGIADEAQLYIYKVFQGKKTSAQYLFEAFDKAVNDGCDVINMSLGSNDLGTAEINKIQSMVDSAREKNIIVVAAVGNNSSSIMNYPAGCDGVVGVGSVDKSNSHSSFSNYNKSVFVTAPGEYIVSTWYGSSSSYLPAGGEYTDNSNNKGTSFSTPVVTAMAALAKQVNKDMTTDEFEELLIETSTDLGTSGYDVYYGYGLVNIEEFVKALNEKYPMSIELDENRVCFSNVYKSMDMYTASYSDGVLKSVSADDMTGSGELPVDIPEDCDSVKLFFWDGLKPVWETIEVKISSDTEIED